MTRTETHTLTTETPAGIAKRAVLALAAVGASLALLPATGEAATKFGAKLNGDVQPSNSSPAHYCSPLMGEKCTRISMEAYGRPDGGEKAPRDGVIKKIKLIAGTPGKFKLQLAKAKAKKEKGKVVRNGPKIRHGSSVPADPEDPYEVQKFKVDVPVHKGEYLAIKSKRTSVLRCSSGGPNQLLFQPALSPRGSFETADDTDGCWLLIEGVIK